MAEDQLGLQKGLIQQKTMKKEKRNQIDHILEAIDRVEESLQSDEFNYNSRYGKRVYQRGLLRFP